MRTPELKSRIPREIEQGSFRVHAGTSLFLPQYITFVCLTTAIYADIFSPREKHNEDISAYPFYGSYGF